jgi:IMP cyclohydrolase
MQANWPQLSKFIYPGRFLIVGKTNSSYYTIYGVTARSASSRAKKYIFNREKNTISVEPTDEKLMSEGNLDLLSYDAVHLYRNAVVLGNGAQTNLIKIKGSAANSLSLSLQSESYEPDKYNTPRITAVLLENKGEVSHAMSIIKANESLQTLHEVYDLTLTPTQGYFLSTYSGENIKPTPSFTSNPILIEIDFKSVEDAAEQTYNWLSPKEQQDDLRVSVIAIETDFDLNEKSVAIINYHK